MNLFVIKNNNPFPSPEALLIPEFKALWDRDKTTGRLKTYAVEDMGYVHYMMDYQSPYRAYPLEERKKEVRKAVIQSRSRWKEDDLIIAAMERYDKLQETPNMRFLKAVEQTLEGLTFYFDNLNFDPTKEVDGKKVPVSDAKKAMDAVAQAGKLLSSVQELREKVRSEQNMGSTIRGGGQAGDYER